MMEGDHHRTFETMVVIVMCGRYTVNLYHQVIFSLFLPLSLTMIFPNK